MASITCKSMRSPTHEGNQFHSPSSSDTDGDQMPDGWEHLNGINPRDGMNGIEDPDMDGFDADDVGQYTTKS